MEQNILSSTTFLTDIAFSSIEENDIECGGCNGECIDFDTGIEEMVIIEQSEYSEVE